MFLGIDIGGTNIKMVVLRKNGGMIAHRSISSNVEKGPEDAFARMAAVVPSLLDKKASVVAAGVACAGLVNQAEGKLHSSPNLPEWTNAPLSRIARKRFGVHTVVDNDANAAAYGEYFQGSGGGQGTLVCLTLGTGVGGAVVIDGRLLRGSKNYAGEIGHMTICETGPRCHCGSRGCLEAYVGSYGLIREARRMVSRRAGRYLTRWVEDGRELTPRLIAEAASRGDRAARGIFEEAGMHLGTGIANLINIFNPDLVVIGGGVAKGYPLMRPRVVQEIRKRAFPESRRAARIVRARLGTRAAAVGAALLARDSGAAANP
jgi:glucokinase